MAEDLIGDLRLEAGQRYCDALDNMGFRPEGVLWAIEVEGEDPRLLLITDLVERIGPLEIIETLFEAFDKACVPTDISPWTVDVFATDAIFPETLAKTRLAASGYIAGTKGDGNPFRYETDDVYNQIQGYKFLHRWIYRLPKKKKADSVEQIRHWKRFKSAVAIAA